MGFFELFSSTLAGLYAIVPSYGLAIILLTVLTRLILLPLSIKQTRSMREMQKIQPEIKKIQAKYKGNRQKMNEELMKLYQEHKVNPFGGCLPLVLQFPVLIALFYVIRTPLKYMAYSLENNGWIAREVSGFLGTVQDSALARGLDTMGLEVNRFFGLRLDCFPSQVLSKSGSETISVACGSGVASFIPYLLLILLMAFTTYYQQKQMQASQPTGSPQAGQMQLFARIMPIMLAVFAFNFPTGVVLYWITTNLWTIGQQRLILRTHPPIALPAGAGKTSESPRAAFKSSGQTPAKAKSSGQTPAKAKTSNPSSSKKKRKR